MLEKNMAKIRSENGARMCEVRFNRKGEILTKCKFVTQKGRGLL